MPDRDLAFRATRRRGRRHTVTENDDGTIRAWCKCDRPSCSALNFLFVAWPANAKPFFFRLITHDDRVGAAEEGGHGLPVGS